MLSLKKNAKSTLLFILICYTIEANQDVLSYLILYVRVVEFKRNPLLIKK